MQIRYSEGPLSVSVPALNREIKRGEVVTVPDDLGKQLVVQGWEQVKSKTTSVKENN